MSSKQGFSWKSIEEKPVNWETIRYLIQDAYDPKEDVRDRYWNNRHMMKVCLEVFPELKYWISYTPEEVVKSKKPVSRKVAIQERVEDELIRKEIQTIRIDPKTMYPMKIKFDMQVTFLFMLLVWNYSFFKKKEVSTTHKKVWLDAIISFLRFYEQEYELIENQDLKKGMVKARQDIMSRIDESMYQVLFENPILLVESTTEKRQQVKRLYPEQRLILDTIKSAVEKDEPLLLGNQMPTGTGKTFLTVPLAKLLSKMNKTVLFTCSNELVNKDVASTGLLADDLHVWLARLIMKDGMTKPTVLLRPYKRCFPATWKKVYKNEDTDKTGSIEEQWNFYVKATKKIPDLIVADVEATLELLKEANTIGNPFVAYIDEFISDDQSNKIVADICHYLPKQTVLLSSILPQFETMPRIVSHFCSTYKTTVEKAVDRVATADVNIACAIIDQEGYLRMPHHHVVTQEDMRQLHREIKVNPRIRRAYPAKHVYEWANTMEDIVTPYGLRFHDKFPDIGYITNTHVIDYAIELIAFLEDHPEYIERCQQYRPRIFQTSPDKMKMFTEQSSMYEGKTLFITKDVFVDVEHMTRDVYDHHIRWSTLVEQFKKNQDVMELQLSKLEKSKMNKQDKMRILSDLQDTQPSLVFPTRYVLNSKEHYRRFHPTEPMTITPRMAVCLPASFLEAFPDHMNMEMSSGIGLYDKQRMSEYQRNLVMSIYMKLAFLCSGKDIVFGTNLPGLTNIFIDNSFVQDESIPTLYQLMGRVGRVGRSYHANIILNREESVQKMLSLRDNIADTTDMDHFFSLGFAC